MARLILGVLLSVLPSCDRNNLHRNDTGTTYRLMKDCSVQDSFQSANHGLVLGTSYDFRFVVMSSFCRDANQSDESQ